MPTCLEAVYAMLACARIGAIHSVVFGGFSANALKERILDSECKIVFTTDQGMRKGRPVNLKEIVDEAVKELKCVEHVIIHKNTGGKIDMQEPRDIWFEEGIERQETECEIEKMDSESELFLLYTSGSTGKPKGIAHTTAGYLLYTAITFRYIFNYHEGDVHACVADIGWITGHSYVVYGPLCVGATSMLFDGVPIHPDASRYWEVIEKHKVTTFYTSPTAIRLLMQFSDDYVLKHDLSSLRIIGSVGEPINPEAWRWYYKVVGQEKCTVVDTYWQTETGGVILTPIPSVTPLKPGATSLPFFGIQPVVLDPNSGDVIDTMVADGVLAIKSSWPGIARSIYGDHDRYLMTYFSPYPGFYFTGDSVHRDQHGYFWINGRVDDVINVSGHRLGTMEIESALVSHPACVEAAVVGTPHDIKGQSIFAYCTINPQYKHLDPKELEAMLKNQVAQQISKIAIPDTIVFTNTLPKTRSGKIMRRILRKISTDSNPRQSLGDISTLSDPAVVDTLINKVQELLGLPKRCDLQ
ncbi:acetyl-coenzyme a synthetase [Anaeramoeba ignava]|uniref:Acetyl-coenzyme A synthetase n=1 Tax=Anaeramoeba ignava TaxID=1746090 RepID=A0A9Q0LTV3_ANAIG|nr:acetyl-coenzyme a synthetase [Anaeramoeba ignava]